ncbi:exosome complex component RRP46 [Pseudohyphozyma bogoriensis]|nr:exosome complex component RRP46 [Pseudohyphozyma bogoriensis]
MASVTGPAEVRIRAELVDRATLEVNVVSLRGLPGPSSKSTESFISTILTPIILLHVHPRSLVQLTLQTITSPTTSFSSPLSTDPTSTLNLPTTSTSPLGLATGISEKASLINAATLALMDSAVECRGMVWAVAVAFVRNSAGEVEMLLDPTTGEEAESLLDAQQLAADGARGLMAFVRRSIELRYGVDPSASTEAAPSAKKEEEDVKMEE